MGDAVPSHRPGSGPPVRGGPFVAIGAPPCATTGGNATLIELGRALHEGGVPAVLLTNHGRIAHRFESGPRCETPLSILPEHLLLPRGHPRRPQPPRRRRKRIRYRIRQGLDRFECSILRQCPSPEGAVAYVGSHPDVGGPRLARAAKILNHAGSPDSFMEWWMSGIADGLHREAGYREHLRRFDAVLFQARAHADEALHLGAVEDERAFVLRPTCDEPRLEAAHRAPSPFPRDVLAAVYVGSLQERKDQAAAIRGFARVAGAHERLHLYLVGGTGRGRKPYAERLSEIAHELSIADRVHLVGHQDDHEPYLAHAHIVLQTSRSEGVARSLREAAFLAKPIVATRLSGTEELLGADGGLLVEVGGVEALGTAVGRLAQDAELRRSLGEGARARYDRSWSASTYAAAARSLFEPFLADRPWSASV